MCYVELLSHLKLVPPPMWHAQDATCSIYRPQMHVTHPLGLTTLPHAAAGLPANNDRTFCTSGVSAACYFYQPTAANYGTASARCESMGGFLASWNSAAEQVRTMWSDLTARPDCMHVADKPLCWALHETLQVFMHC